MLMEHPDGRAPMVKVNSRPARQERSIKAVGRISSAVLSVIAEHGLGGLTHRRVAERAGVSLAATTYYYATKDDMIADASARLLASYVESFVRAAARQRAGVIVAKDLDELLIKLIRNAAGRHREHILAWCEIILDAGRTEAGHRVARDWFERMEAAWAGLAKAMGIDQPASAVRPAIDRMIGLLFMTVSLGLTPDQVALGLGRRCDPLLAWEPDIEEDAEPSPSGHGLTPKTEATRKRIVAAAIDLLIEGNASNLSYRTLAEGTGLSIAAPAYHYGSIRGVLGAAQAHLFELSKDRYREVMLSAGDSRLGLEGLTDLTTAIFVREATEYRQLNIATYALWLEAARQEKLRPILWWFLLNRARPWSRRIADLRHGERQGETAYDAFSTLAFFIGKLIRMLSIGATTADLAEIRNQFLTHYRQLCQGG